ncbi:MAG: hypothetical protein OXN81_16755 [Alphaproteobacteria bacterium]|nr:hypothetical protein [Alphaproteobacteria bacterium]
MRRVLIAVPALILALSLAGAAAATPPNALAPAPFCGAAPASYLDGRNPIMGSAVMQAPGGNESFLLCDVLLIELQMAQAYAQAVCEAPAPTEWGACYAAAMYYGAKLAEYAWHCG